jgi:hypothetical protein
VDRRLAHWLIGSLALHLAALPLLARVAAPAPPASASASRDPVREIELVASAPAPAATTVSPRELAPAPATPARSAIGPARAMPRRVPGSPAGTPTAEAAAGPLLSMRGAGNAPASTRRPLDLTPSARVLLGESGDLGRGPGGGAAAALPRDRGTGGGGEAARTKRKLDELLAEDRDHQDLESGRVHPFLYKIERTAEGSFRPSWSLVESDRLGRGSLKRSYGALLVGMGKQYLDALRRYREAHRGLEEADRPRMLEGYNKLMRIAAGNASTMACELCVAVGLRGELPEVKLRRRSGNRSFDALALESMRRTARLEKAPTDAPASEACYEFSASFHRVPPLPYVGCSFDESKPSISCFYPTKKILNARVKLVSNRSLGGQPRFPASRPRRPQG